MRVRTLHPGVLTALWLLPFLALLQSSVASHVAVLGAMPNFVLIAVVNWGILRGMDEGMIWAFIGGLCLDVFSNWPFGTGTVALVIVTSLVSLGESAFMRTHALLPLATVFAATILYYLIALFILQSVQQPVDWSGALRQVALPAAIFNAVLNIPAFWFTKRLEDRIYPVARANW